MTIKRTLIDSTIEEQIVTGMITSTKFLTEIRPLYNSDYFQSFVAKPVSFWCIDYFDQYNKAPEKHIEDIYNIESEHMKSEDKELIGIYLSKISKRYGEGQEINADYVRDNAFRFFRKRALELGTTKMQSLLVMDKVDEAEEIMIGYKKITKQIEGFSTPFDARKIMDVFFDDDRDFMKLPDAVGEIVGKIERGWFVALVAPFKRGKCVIEGSLITMADGSLKPIEKIIENEESVLSKNKEDQLTTNRVVKVINQGSQEVYKLKTYTGREIEVTNNHPFFTAKGWIPLEHLSIGDHIAVPKKYPELGTNTLPIEKLKLLAYLIADGCLRGTSYTYSKNNEELQKDFKKCVEFMGDVISDKGKNNCSMIVKKDKGCNGHTYIKVWFESLGLAGILSKNKEIPEIIFTLTNDNISVFLSTLFTGDGSVWKDKNNLCISYATSSKKMAKQVQHLLLRFGIVSVIESRLWRGFHSYEIIISGSYDTNKFIKNIGFLFNKKEKCETILASLQEKRCCKSNINAVPYEVIKEIIPYEFRWRSNAVGFCYKKKGKISCTSLPMILNSYPNNENLKRLINNDILWDKIVEITYIGKKETYDLSIEKDHNFITNDIIVHNSWWLQEMAVRAYFQGFKVLFVSLEMSEKNLNDRLYKRFTATGNKQSEETYIYPTFDCAYNQDNSCERKERTNRILLARNGVTPHYDEDMEYRPCTYCRKHGLKDYKVETWFESITQPQYKHKTTKEKLDALKIMYGDSFHIKAYPRFSANLKDISSYLHKLEQTEGFIPDVIIIDYADILKPDTKGDSIHQIDDTWKMLAAMAAERHCILFTVGQGTRDAMKKADIGGEDNAGWIGKLAHADIYLGLNQTSEEKRSKVSRIVVTHHRHRATDESKQALILQQFETGQFMLDSEIVWRNV